MAVLEVQAALARLQEGAASANTSAGTNGSVGAGGSASASGSAGASASAGAGTSANVSGSAGASASGSASASALSVDKTWSHSCALCHRRLAVLYKVGLDIRHNRHQNRHHHSYVSLILISQLLLLSLLSCTYVVSCSLDAFT